MNQEDHIAEDHVINDYITVTEFTAKEWNGNSSFSIRHFFSYSAGFSVVGVVVALLLMIFLPDMRNSSYVVLFSAAFGIIFGLMFQKAEQGSGKVFLTDFSTKINILLTELAGNELQNISPSQLRELIDSGEGHPLTVDGVAGLYLMVYQDQFVHTALPSEPAAAMEPPPVGKSHPSARSWQVLIAAEAPQYGTESFDRLLAAATPTGRTEQ